MFWLLFFRLVIFVDGDNVTSERMDLLPLWISLTRLMPRLLPRTKRT
jgi:hypothetical protein